MKNSHTELDFVGDHQLVVGHSQMDDEHEEFARLVLALEHAPEHSLLSCLEAVITHATTHFAHEDKWMNDLLFPARQCHTDEHSAVLRSAAGIRARAVAGDLAAVRLFAQELGTWFPAHVQHLDSALSTWICKQAWNAQPLAFHRLSRAPGATATL